MSKEFNSINEHLSKIYADFDETTLISPNKSREKEKGIIAKSEYEIKKEVITILRAVHKYKDSREQFEMRTHKRLIDLEVTPKAADALRRLDLPAGVDIKVDLK